MSVQYIIEDDIDFYGELTENVDVRDDMRDDLRDDLRDVCNNNTCLITNEPLIKDHIKLTCGHIFNYIPLMKALKGKTKKIYKTSKFIIYCPYCRATQTDLLPFYKKPGVSHMNGIHMSKEAMQVMKKQQKTKQQTTKQEKFKCWSLVRLMIYSESMRM